MYEGKYKDILLDGRWKIIRSCPNSKGSYVVENIYNHKQIKLSHKQVEKVINGKDTVSHIMSRRINVWSYYIDNRVCIAHKGNIKKFAKPKEEK